MSVEVTREPFTVRFAAGQEVPAHRNASRVVITVVRGTGVITVEGMGDRLLVAGTILQLDANLSHGVVAGDEGLELLVAETENCCKAC